MKGYLYLENLLKVNWRKLIKWNINLLKTILW